MKKLSLINNAWIERVVPSVTPGERAVLENLSAPPSPAQREVIESIKARSVRPADPADAAAAQAIYDQHKLAGATLIAVDIALPSGKGIINCRVSGEHRQIRF